MSKPQSADEGAQAVLRRVEDDELQLGDMRGGQLDDAAESMSAADVGTIIQILIEQSRTVGDRPGWRYSRAIYFLREVHQRKRDEALSLKQREQAGKHVYRGKEGKTWRREICTCGQKHPSGANFYVSVRDGDRTRLLKGPFRTHAEAIEAVPAAQRQAEKMDPKAAFYFFGTAAKAHDYRKPGLLSGRTSLE